MRSRKQIKRWDRASPGGRPGLGGEVRVEDYRLEPGMTVADLARALGRSGGFQAVNLARGVEILSSMWGEMGVKTFLAFTANLVATGLRGVLAQVLELGMFDVLVTTAGTIDHDLIRCWGSYRPGSFYADDAELHRRGVARLGNVFVPISEFTTLEEKIQPFLSSAYGEKRTWGCAELVGRMGEELACPGSILRAAAEAGVPVYVPGITDGAVGNQLWLFRESHPDFQVDVLRDQVELAELVFGAEKTGALILGGGIAKHHTIGWNMFKGGLDYAVYVTTAAEYDGSLSGARDREAVSWGKISEGAARVTVVGDATIVTPLLLGAALEEVGWRRACGPGGRGGGRRDPRTGPPQGSATPAVKAHGVEIRDHRNIRS